MTGESGNPTETVDQADKPKEVPSDTTTTTSHPPEGDQQSLTESKQDNTPQTDASGWGWGFDVNAVAGNIGGLFGASADNEGDDDGDDEESEDESDAEDEDEHGGAEPENELGKTAADIANAATAEFEIASKAAQETIGKAAEEIGKGWGTLNNFLDDMLAAKPDGHNAPTDDGNIHSQFQSMFPKLAEEDEVVDHFRCVLLQKYRCYLNNSTPEKSYALRGRLFVSTAHIAMYVTDDGGEFGGKPFGISIPFKDVGKIQKGAKAMLKLVTKEPISYSYIFAEFESDSHFSGALSLLEHMNAASTSQPPSSALSVVENESPTAT